MKKIRLQELLREQMMHLFCEELETQIKGSVQVNPKLKSYLDEAQEIIFEPMGINPADKGKYFVAGSARLYLYPDLAAIMNLKGNPGDLDIVVTDPNAWSVLESNIDQIDPSLRDDVADKRIFRPTAPDNTLEAFDEWKPGLAVKDKSEVEDTSVRSSEQIQKDAKLVEGYYYMSMYDILDYKLKLGRDKEKPLAEYLVQYHNESNTVKKQEIANKILNVFADEPQDAENFLNPKFAAKAQQVVNR